MKTEGSNTRGKLGSSPYLMFPCVAVMKMQHNVMNIEPSTFLFSFLCSSQFYSAFPLPHVDFHNFINMRYCVIDHVYIPIFPGTVERILVHKRKGWLSTMAVYIDLI